MTHRLTLRKINEIALDAANATLKPNLVDRVMSEPATDSVGGEALRITIVIKPGAEAKIKGDAVLDMLVQVQDRLQKAGDDRFPIIEYATARELRQSASN